MSDMPSQFVFEFENPFDVEAEWISHLRACDESLFYDQDLRKTSQPAGDLEEEVAPFFHSLPYLSNGRCLLRSGVPPEEKQAVRAWEHYGDFFHMLQLLSLYTEQMTCAGILSSPYFFSITHTTEGQEKEFESLNVNAEKTGFLILPKVRTVNDPLDPAGEEDGEPVSAAEQEPVPDTSAAAMPEKRWAADRMPGIQDELSHTFYVEVDQLVCGGRRYRVANSVLQRHVFAENGKTLKIAVCPLAHADLLEIRTYSMEKASGPQRLCCAEGLKSWKLVQDKVCAALLCAGQEEADLVIFPEMLGSGEVLDPVFFAGVREKLADRGYPMPPLILMPSWWHDCRNELHVLNRSGTSFCIQQKQTQYLFEKDGLLYAEDLREPEPVIHVVHVPEVGRLTFPICKDFLNEEYIRLMLRQLRATFLMCPSYSPQKTQFDLASGGGIPYGCYSVWCNTCAAYHDKPLPDHIGLVAGPQGPGGVPCLLAPECGGDCEGGESACVFLVEISVDRSADISYRHMIGTSG